MGKTFELNSAEFAPQTARAERQAIADGGIKAPVEHLFKTEQRTASPGKSPFVAPKATMAHPGAKWTTSPERRAADFDRAFLLYLARKSIPWILGGAAIGGFVGGPIGAGIGGALGFFYRGMMAFWGPSR